MAGKTGGTYDGKKKSNDYSEAKSNPHTTMGTKVKIPEVVKNKNISEGSGSRFNVLSEEMDVMMGEHDIQDMNKSKEGISQQSKHVLTEITNHSSLQGKSFTKTSSQSNKKTTRKPDLGSASSSKGNSRNGKKQITKAASQPSVSESGNAGAPRPFHIETPVTEGNSLEKNNSVNKLCSKPDACSKSDFDVVASELEELGVLVPLFSTQIVVKPTWVLDESSFFSSLTTWIALILSMISPKRTTVLMNDVMFNILVRLPLKSLLQCKCVCKLWQNLISDPVFIFNYSRQHPQYQVSGFYLEKYLFLQLHSELLFIPWEGQDEAVPETSLSFIGDDKGIYIKHSCNGLLLCSSFRCHDEDREYYVCKPTTKQYLPLLKPPCEKVLGISIAYDPNKSPNYQVICISESEVSFNHRQIKIYSSATGSWRDSGNPFIIFDEMLFNRGVYWNGALHWVGNGDLSLRFDVQKELMLTMPMPPIPEELSERKLSYFGESGGHLYLIEIYDPLTTVFDVMEMRSDYSSWSVKYHVDINTLKACYYDAMVRRHRIVFSVLHILHRQVGDEDESVLALQIRGALLLYNLGDNTFVELPDMFSSGNQNLGLLYTWERVHPYTNPLCYI
ncbi:hypothetical protein LWI29_029675 [Acer saccharum]|uniref:F-box domain-containing protein n=1 Tax=Acer saccharum TaxID=4024 RepID=A0AA39SVB7_ACESA|nr:hypothetical protein LWI29_029675 [Acer saccharum]